MSFRQTVRRRNDVAYVLVRPIAYWQAFTDYGY